MGNHIVMEPAYKIREIARHALTGYWKPVVLGVLIYYLLSTGVMSFLDYFFAYDYPVEVYEGEVVETSFGFGGSIYSLIIGGPLQFGISMFLLTFFRARKCDNTLLFEGFSNFSRTFVLSILVGVKVLLWSLLFIIPGIVASFRYSQAFYIMVDNPTWTPSQCIRESCRIMNGNKGRYFWLQLTFLGWYMLASLPEAIYVAVSPTSGTIGGIITTLLLALPALIVDAYSLTAQTAFYELATERLVVVNDYEPENVVHAEYTVEENPQNEETDFHEE